MVVGSLCGGLGQTVLSSLGGGGGLNQSPNL
jgi:hypothetical protein